MRTVSVVSRADIPVMTLDDLKRDLDITFDDDDALVSSHLASAISYVEQYTNRFLVPVVLNLILDRLDGILRLPYGPIIDEPTISVDGVAVVGLRAIGGSPYAVLPPLGQSWPYTATGAGVIVTFSAGYAAGTVPEALLGAVRQIVSIFYDKPQGNELTAQWASIERILSPLKIRSI